MVMMPFTYSITNGIGMGFITFVVLRLAAGQTNQKPQPQKTPKKKNPIPFSPPRPKRTKDDDRRPTKTILLLTSSSFGPVMKPWTTPGGAATNDPGPATIFSSPSWKCTEPPST